MSDFDLESELDYGDRQVRVRLIQAEFKKTGGLTLRSFAQYLLANLSIYSDAFREEAQIRAVMGECRRALKQHDKTGLPFAGPTLETDEESGAPVWRTRQGWLFPDYCVAYTDYEDMETEGRIMKNRISDECTGRYGKPPYRVARGPHPIPA